MQPQATRKKTKGHGSGPVVPGRLKSFVERIERVREDKKAAGSDERDIFTEAKSAGYDAATIRWILKEREADSADRAERDALRETYAHALGLAVEMVRVEGLSLRQAEAATGASKSSIQRALAVPEMSREMVADDLGSFTESCGGVESRHAPSSGSGPLPEPMLAAGDGRHQELKRTAGVAPGPQDSPPATQAPAKPRPVAIASESERVAEPDITIPDYLDRRPKQAEAA